MRRNACALSSGLTELRAFCCCCFSEDTSPVNPPLSGDWITHGMRFLEIKAVGSMEGKKKAGVDIRCPPKETRSTLLRVMCLNVATSSFLSCRCFWSTSTRLSTNYADVLLTLRGLCSRPRGVREDRRPQRAGLCCLLVTELATCVRAAGQVPRNTLRQGFAGRALIAEHSWNRCLGGREGSGIPQTECCNQL